jgi:hypothetical protein
MVEQNQVSEAFPGEIKLVCPGAFRGCILLEEMSYYVRLLTASEKVVPFSEIGKQGNFIKLISGTAAAWEQIEVYQPENKLIAIVERHSLSENSSAANELAQLKDSLGGSYPVNAREWLRKYLSTVKTIYTFQLQGDKITKHGWPVLGRIQNLLKDTLRGIIQADKEGYYNENGDYILWQMYSGAAGTIPAATLDENGDWIPFQLRLDDNRTVDQFKQGIPPQKGLLNRILGRK